MPNPVRERLRLKIEFPVDIKGSVQLIDGKGRLLYISENNFSEGTNYLTITEVANWPAGIYYIRLNTGASNILEKFSLTK